MIYFVIVGKFEKVIELDVKFGSGFCNLVFYLNVKYVYIMIELIFEVIFVEYDEVIGVLNVI